MRPSGTGSSGTGSFSTARPASARPSLRERSRASTGSTSSTSPRATWSRGSSGGSARNIDKAFETAEQNLPVPALLRRVRLRRPAARQHAGSGVAAHRQPAADLARGAPRRARPPRHGGDELPRASRPGGHPARAASTATSGSTCLTQRRGEQIFETELDERPMAQDVDLDELVRRDRGHDAGGDREDRRHRRA